MEKDTDQLCITSMTRGNCYEGESHSMCHVHQCNPPQDTYIFRFFCKLISTDFESLLAIRHDPV